ncbi:transcriptional regulator ATRX [Halyomorpha halys]|uniref:transcriptional regulator ATRX n=1 Tax=Halyomorpha halys TaxID=286706 RepID=UPI0006D4F782
MVIPVSKPKVSQTEKKYRQELFPDVKEIKNKNLLCTSCGSSVKDLITKGKPIIHPFLETLLCEKCHSFYGDGQFSVDEDGSDKYCRWCGQGGTLFLCSKCTSGFCKRCVKRNLPKSAQAKIEDDDWVCYCCDTSPLYELRAQGWAAQQYAADYVKSKGSSKVKKGSKENSKRPRHSDSSETEEPPVPSKKKRKEELKGKNDKKRRNGDEKEDGGGRSLRKRDSKATKNESGSESDDQSETSSKTLPSGVSVDRIHAALNKLTSFVADIAGMTKETHKKILECKNKKINLKNINSTESVLDIHSKLSSMLVTLESNVRIVRKGLEEYVEEWCKMVKEDLKIKGEKEEGAAEKAEDSERLENGIPSEGSESKEKSVEPEPEDMEVCEKNGEEKDHSSDKESNDGDSVVEEKKSPKKQIIESANGDGKDKSLPDQITEERIPQVAEKKDDESTEEGHGDSVIEEGKGKVSSEAEEQASSTAETTVSSNDSDPPGETS